MYKAAERNKTSANSEQTNANGKDIIAKAAAARRRSGRCGGMEEVTLFVAKIPAVQRHCFRQTLLH